MAVALLPFAGCSPSYPKGKITESVSSVIKKEYNLDGKAKLVGETLFLDVNLSGLITTEPKILTSILKKIQGAVLAITRVSLSSDARIKFMVVTATDPSWKINVRIIQRLEDVKGYLYQRISRSDYEDSLILEINQKSDENSSAPNTFEQIQEMDTREFLGRLIVSNINMLGRSNPFLSIVLGNSQLKFTGITDNELVISIDSIISPQVTPLFEEILVQKTGKLLRRFNGYQLKKIKVMDPSKTLLIEVPR
jgi:hypothetical protein